MNQENKHPNPPPSYPAGSNPASAANSAGGYPASIANSAGRNNSPSSPSYPSPLSSRSKYSDPGDRNPFPAALRGNKGKWEHSMNRRSRINDYQGRRIYMITMTKSAEAPCFGSLAGDPKIAADKDGAPYIIPSPMGDIIERELQNIKNIHPDFEIFRKVIMPDHIHFLIYVKEEIDRHFGRYMAIFKKDITQEMRRVYPHLGEIGASAFVRNYNDRILVKEGQLEVLKKYISDNPRRLAIMRNYPDFFTRGMEIILDKESKEREEREASEEKYEAFGNPFLIQKPYRFQVFVRSAWTPEEFEKRKKEWLAMAAEGGIAVSPFYSAREKTVREEILNRGGSVIYIRNEKMGERSKPQGRDFELCREGRLLIIYEQEAPEYAPTLKRSVAMHMNDIARKIAEAGVINPIFRVKRYS